MARLLLLLAALAGCRGSDPVGEGRLDGLWAVREINGNAPTASFLLRIRGGRVVGGRDGCNSWGFDLTQPPAPDGSRLIISDAQACTPTRERSAYWRALGNGNARPTLTKERELKLQVGIDEIVAAPAARGAASARP